MNYLDLLKRAYKLTIKNRFLWIFGLFVGSAATFGGFGNFFDPGKSGAADQGRAALAQHQIAFWLNQHFVLLVGLAFILILFIILCFIFSFLAEGALIGGAQKIAHEEKMDFVKAFKVGSKHFWRIWGLSLVFSLIILLAIFILGVPALAFVSNKLYILAIGWGIISFIIVWVLAMIIMVTKPYALRILVLENKKIIFSLRESIHFVRKNLVDVILVYLSLAVVSFIFALSLIFGLFLVGSILVMIGAGLWFVSKIVATFYIVIMGIILLLTLFTLGGAYHTFQSVTLTLAYEELKKNTSS